VLFPLILGRVREHFNEIVVKRVVELALELPGELRAIEIARMDREYVSVHGGRAIFQIVFQIDEDLDEAVGFAGGEGEQGMVIEAQVVEDFRKLRGVGHRDIVTGGWWRHGIVCPEGFGWWVGRTKGAHLC